MLRGALGRPPVIVVNAGLVRNLLSYRHGMSSRWSLRGNEERGDNPKHTDICKKHVFFV